MFANKLILHALAILIGPLSPVGVALAQQTSREPDCEDIQKNTAKPAKATATVRGEFLKNGKTLVQDIFLSPGDGPRTRAFVIKPYKPASDTGGAVLFLHWLGSPPDNDRSEFFGDAVQLANHGVTSLLVEAPWADPEWFPNRKLDEDLLATTQYMAQLQSYFDYLITEAKPKEDKIALVGHDFGAMYGALLLPGVNAIRYAVIIAAVPDFADWFLLNRKLSESETQQYRERMSVVAPSRYLRCAHNLDVLFQFAKNDRFVSREQASAFIDSARAGKTVLWYPGGHDLQQASRKDRVEWLLKRVGTKNP